MFTKIVELLLAVSLLQWCQVPPSVPALASKAPARYVKVRIIPRLYDIQHCKNMTHSLVVKNASTHLEKDGTEYLDVDFDLTTTARRLLAFRLVIHRCPLGVGGGCEYFNTWSWNMPVCALLLSNGMLWTPTIQSIRPRWACPLLKGSYEGRNVTVDMAALGKVIEGLSVDKYAWPVQVQLDSEKGLYACYSFIAQCRRARVKGN